jgi:hypothetical protein
MLLDIFVSRGPPVSLNHHLGTRAKLSCFKPTMSLFQMILEDGHIYVDEMEDDSSLRRCGSN